MTRSGTVRSYGGVSAEERRADRRARLIAAGRRVWGESGLAAVTVRGICKAAGLTDRYFYEHFASREELLVAVADDVRDQLLAVMVQAGLTEEGSASDKLESALRAFLDAIAEDPHVHRIAASDPAGVPGLAQRRRDVLATIADLVVQNAPDALGETPDPQLLHRSALFITGGVNQLIEAWLDGTIDMTTAELAAEAAWMCLAVLTHRPA
ncbi:TetR/AcrR family transcriptional regulator [Nocardia transvalensis]|uniref:TetR/AcrR family transcriptional regulator n=1 Tax=Nocardia transvalensis TaxID=37333 RepID=UPI00189467CC|nr:TetR/AcrR family transcriptional regulator [Nocardia transvalensis]MBF6330492.1 TetR/AcrR family transcriptional regulator [Nocardia transvalensis]